VGESEVVVDVASEAELGELARRVALHWRDGGGAEQFLSVGLSGDLGAGKTAWVRALLRGLGHTGPVPSPTYTLMEIYEISPISLIHMDFYRLGSDRDLAGLGIRDWLGQPACWVIAEWPERAPQWAARCDVAISMAISGATARRMRIVAQTPQAMRWLEPFELT